MDPELEDIWDELDDVDLSDLDRREKAEEFERRAAESERGSLRWAEMLVAASEHRLELGEHALAIAQLEDVRAAGPELHPSVEAHLLAAHLTAGHDEEVATLDRELRARSRDVDLGDDYHWVGEAYEEAGRLKEALRWFSMANRDIDPDDLEALEPIALSGRLRVRRLLDLPEDAYDATARIMRAHEAAMWAAQRD